MRVSVVINTCDRGASLRQTLAALRHQTHPSFEVVVVNGPSSDDTEDILAALGDAVRVYRCPERHLSKSRNVGIAHAAGEVVAFIDDDAIPEPGWLAGLAAAYADPAVGGAGGIVHDHTGAALQYERSVATRLGVTQFDVRPPFDRYCRPGADPFLQLLGTNCSFRRGLLVETGGFNEEFEYYLDETEVCLRVIDAGYRLAPLAGAAVHHKYLPSHIRDPKRALRDPFPVVKNHAVFAVRNGCRTRPVTEVLASVAGFAARVKAEAEAGYAAGELTADRLAEFLARVDRAVETGVRIGLTQDRPFRRLPAADPGVFRPFPTLRPVGGRLKICYVSREFPPDTGGIGRFTADLARGVATEGHEVHVVTRGTGGRTIDFEAGVWVHRLPDVTPPPAVGAVALGFDYAHAANVYHEVARIHESCGGLDVVSAPVWLCEGAVCALDGRWPTVLTLMTTMKTIAGMGGATGDNALVAGKIALEAATVRRAGHVHAISRDILGKARDAAGRLEGTEFVVPLGTSDVRDRFPRSRAGGGRVRILFVGRLERRKGVDLLLEAAYQVLTEFPQAELVLVGRTNPDGGETGLDRHRDVVRERPELAGRIVFAGEVGEDALYQHYADCDVFVLPSRYESFGLVLTEAMMFGRPVVAAAAGGPAEIVTDGTSGLLVRPGDPAALADALRLLLADPALRDRLGRGARARYEERFTAGAMVANTLAAYREIVAAHRSEPADVERRLAELVGEASPVPADVAARIAADLVSADVFDRPRDYPRELAALWPLPDEEFVRGVYPLVFGRPADPLGFHHFTAALRDGMPRLDLLRHLLGSDEAAAKRIPGDWLNSFTPPGSQPPRPVARPAARTAAGRVARAVRAVLLLPWTARRLREQTDELVRLLNAVRSPAAPPVHVINRELAERVVRALELASARERQAHWLLSEHAVRRDRRDSAAA